MVKLDLKHAYFSILINWEHRKYVCFAVGNSIYQFKRFPFSLASDLGVLMKILKLVAVYGWELWMGLIVNMTDNLLMVKSSEMSWDSLGLSATINIDKFLY